MNPLPYFILDSRKRKDDRFRIYIRQNIKPPIVIPTEFFVKRKSEFKNGYPRDPILKNLCLELFMKIGKELDGVANLKECWDTMNNKTTHSELVIDWMIIPNRYQLKKFNAKLKVSELTRDILNDYMQHLRKELKDVSVSNHIAELKRIGKKAKRYFDIPDSV